MSLRWSKWQDRKPSGRRHSSKKSRAGEMRLRCWAQAAQHFLLLTTTSALPSADAEAEPHLYGDNAMTPMLMSNGPGGQGFNPGGLQPGEGGQGHYPGEAGGGSAVVQPGSVWGGGAPQGDQCGMMDQCCGE